ncbi:outer membrane beta-barrel protein [Flavobacterium yafengii]|uniref:outer membrane beta-barrel protein n=1 Tax=Flavobacterium yafengii TaxID=3041253 RepID=UPI0024A7B1F3|nr:outer membrane beta-barrel protein [Flavobacterium yafengii]MDI6047052.1 outer membrane beta-barrel protein [Flavobacterium yafengii]
MKFNIKNIIGITVCLISQGMAAQFYVGAQSGIGNIQSDVNGTAAGNRLGGAIKAGYIYSLTNHIGIGTGVEFSQYKQEVYLNNSSETLTNYEVDPSTSAFLYNITTGDYNEKQTLHAIQIPLFIQYKTNINKGVDFNFRAGAKYFLPVNYKIKATANYVNGTAYYPDVNLNITDLPEYGFGGNSNYSATGEYQTKGIVMSMFELGFTFDMRENNALYAAIFLENGYGSILDQEKDESYIGYNPRSVVERKANGLYSTDKNAKIRPVAFGITLGWNFK